MPEPGIPQTLLNNMFTRTQLRMFTSPDSPEYALLESAAFDSVYSLHDDFDKGLDPNLWVSQGFNWQEDDFFGSVANISELEEHQFERDELESEPLTEAEPEPTDAFLFSRVKGWRAGRRAVVMARFRLSTTAAGKIEFGFASNSSMGGLGIVPSQSLSTNGNVDNYGFVLWNPADSSSLVYVITRSLPTAGAATSVTPSVPLRTDPRLPSSWTFTSEYYNTLLVALNEQSEVKVYVNGQALRSSGVSGGPASTADLGIWFHVGANATSGAPIVQLDYIHAWQDRIAK